MMQVYLSPQMRDAKSIIKINNDKVQVNDKLYDFTGLSNGILRTATDDILSAKRVNGELHVEIINNLDDTATHDEFFPDWQVVEYDDVLDDDLTVILIDWYSDEERESDELLIGLQPSAQELADADLEIKMITLLMEMEVI